VWTNPLKRIIPHFYANYLKMLAGPENKELHILTYDMLLGAFIFTQEETDFTLLKDRRGKDTKVKLKGQAFSLPKLALSIPFNKRGAMLFILSFILTFGILFEVSQMGLFNFKFELPSFSLPSITIPNLRKPTPTPEPTPTSVPTPTPTPEIKREDLSVKILNGSGVRGKAGLVKSFLQDLGYENILTANADAFDYDVTVIKTKKGTKAIKDIVAKDIASELEGNAKFETLDTNDVADVIIIVGTDFR